MKNLLRRVAALFRSDQYQPKRGAVFLTARAPVSGDAYEYRRVRVIGINGANLVCRLDDPSHQVTFVVSMSTCLLITEYREAYQAFTGRAPPTWVDEDGDPYP